MKWIQGFVVVLGTKRKLMLLQNNRSQGVSEEECITEYLLGQLLDKEELIWRTRSRETWLREGDCNTKFFHAKASFRRTQNRISRVYSEDGRWLIEHDDMMGEALRYFQTLFSSSGNMNSQEVLDLVLPRVSSDMNSDLTRQVTKEEVRVAFFQMHPGKAPGLDGMHASFFQKNWQTSGR